MGDCVSSQYPSTEKRVENTMCSMGVFEEIQGVWIADETVSHVFVKSMLMKTIYPNLLHGCDFLTVRPWAECGS